MTSEADAYVLETDLDAAPENVWKALSEPALREAWLGEAGEVVEAKPPKELTVRCDDDAPRGLVTFTVSPAHDGGARLTIVHRREAAVIPLGARTPPGGWRMAA